MKEPFSAKTLGADMISVSGHKVHAPKGIGALYIRQGLKLPAHILGGRAEEGMRSGTEPMPQIAASVSRAHASVAEMPEANKRMEAARAVRCRRSPTPYLGIVFSAAGKCATSSLPARLPQRGIEAEHLEAGIYVSKSSACKRGKRSHVLEAIGAPDKVIDGALRVSFSRYTTAEECAYFCESARRGAKGALPFPLTNLLYSSAASGVKIAARVCRNNEAGPLKGLLQSPACREAFAECFFCFIDDVMVFYIKWQG